MKVKIRTFDEYPQYGDLAALEEALDNGAEAGLHVFRERVEQNRVTLGKMHHKRPISFLRQSQVRPLPAMQVMGGRNIRVFARNGLLTQSGDFIADRLYKQPLFLWPDPGNQVRVATQLEQFGVSVDAEGMAVLAETSPALKVIPGKTMLFGCAGDGPYSHFVWDTIPTLWFFNQLGPDVRLLVENTLPSYKREFILASGVDPDRIIWRDPDETLLCETLYVPSRISLNNHVISEDGLSILSNLAAPGVREGKRPEGARRIFVDRAGDRAGFRVLKNEDALWEMAKAHGFVKVSPGLLSLEEKQKVFGAAEHVIGQYGGGIQNYFLCAPGTRFLVMQSHAFVRDIMDVTSEWLGHEIINVLGVADDQNAKNSAFTVESDVFSERLDEMVGSSRPG